MLQAMKKNSQKSTILWGNSFIWEQKSVEDLQATKKYCSLLTIIDYAANACRCIYVFNILKQQQSKSSMKFLDYLTVSDL